MGAIAGDAGRLHDHRVGNVRIQSTAPDLFSGSARAAPASKPLPAIAPEHSTPVQAQYVLPKDLPNAVRQLDDQQFDLLLSAVVAEQKRRAKDTRSGSKL